MKQPCKSISMLLEKYFDNEVSSEEKLMVETHISSCPTCQDSLKSISYLRELLKRPVEESIEKEDFPLLWQRIEKQIRLKEKSSVLEKLKSIFNFFDISYALKKRFLVLSATVMAIIIIILIPIFFKKITSLPELSVVEYLESTTHNVLIFESKKEKVTIIWLFEEKMKQELPKS